MRSAAIFSMVLLLSGLAGAQVTQMSGYAGNWASPEVGYASPFVPLVQTPIVSLGTPSMQVGASNATLGNQAGATNSTLSLMGTPALGAALWTAAIPALAMTIPPQYAAPAPMIETPSSNRASSESSSFRMGAAQFQDNVPIASLAKNSGLHQPSKHTYTEQDIQQLPPETGTVKFNGKTERLQ